jgi:uncharacterized protein (DUF433 family)
MEYAAMRKLVSSPDQVAANIRRFGKEVAKSPGLQATLGQVHAWYAVRLSENSWAFGSSKFVGYQDNTAEEYLDTYRTDATGSETERALDSLSQEVDQNSRLGRQLVHALTEFLQRWDRKPRKDARIRVVPEAAGLTIASNRGLDEKLLARISSNPEICGGRPCIRGTRMRVVDIVEALAHGATQQELLRDFDYLTADDIAAALLFSARASDHRLVQTA